MAHIPPSAAIFSPSIARLASSTAKDWNYVDSWLASKFHGRSPPPFERNPDTLKALVALAALNESADEDRDLLANLESSALQALSGNQDTGGRKKDDDDGRSHSADAHADAAEPDPATTMDASSVAEDVIAAIEDHLPREGRAALDALAAASVELGLAADPEPVALGRAVVALQARLFALEQAAARMDALRAYVDAEAAKSQALLCELDGGAYRPAADLAKLNLEVQRKVKAGAARLQEAKDRTDRADRADRAGGPPEITVEQIQQEESLYLDLLARKRDLDAQLQAFQGLPPDRDLARQQLEALRSDLQAVTQKRDSVFENLVERATPKKAS
ncbi:hypothetical protein SPI_08735 [Niveomyces insectorum RCEF 264]|uniref:Uncharacterized protein n=1 Tax=Niveomyces insectorum RCEF 264 TaxID=1081102 RepID=A0A167ML44_9HYPO|nr:hypothetical protein SPI_08735 [Niveomyces insectorum RCEF 264]